MKKKIFLAAGAFVAVCCGSALFLHLKQEAKPLSELALANIEAFTTGETEVGCGGNSTYVKDQTLKSTLCPPLWLGGSHLKCKSETNVCCDPSKQSDCKSVL